MSQPTWYTEPWMEVLRQAVEREGQSRVARRLDYSAATISLILRGTYNADPANVARRVIERLSQETLVCPVLGTIPYGRCSAERARDFSAANPVRVALWSACRVCTHNPKRQEG
jgi:hypothetical protein